MKSTRMFAAPAVVAAGIVLLTGCTVQLPVGTTSDNTATSSAPTVDLTETTWTGTDSRNNELRFTLADDGTIDFSNWNGGAYVNPDDVWSVDGTTLTLKIQGVGTDASPDTGTEVTYTGSVAEGALELDGMGADGTAMTLSVTQVTE